MVTNGDCVPLCPNILPILPENWKYVEESLQSPMSKVPVAGLADFLRVQGCTEMSYPGVPP